MADVPSTLGTMARAALARESSMALIGWLPGYKAAAGVTVAAGKISGTLTNWPGLITGPCLPDALWPYVTREDCGDVRLTLADGTLLSHEVYGGSKAGKTVFLHPLLPSALVGSQVYVQVGHPSAVAPTAGEQQAAWAGYNGVWHLEENPAGSAPQLLDSTSGARHMTTMGGMTSGDLVSAIVGNGLDFDGAALPNTDVAYTATCPVSTGSFCMSCWLNSGGPTAGHEDARAFTVGRDTDGLAIVVWTTDGRLRILQNYLRWINTSYFVTVGQWFYVVVLQNGANLSAWVNGTSVYSGAAGAVLTPTTTCSIGSQMHGLGVLAPTVEYKGLIDEPRVGPVALGTQAWAAADYNNMLAPTSFWATGAVELAPAAFAGGRRVVTPYRLGPRLLPIGGLL